MAWRSGTALLLFLSFATALWAQNSPDPVRKYRVQLDNGSFLEGSLRFAGDSAVVTTSIGRVTLQRKRVIAFTDPASGAKYDWRDFVKPAEPVRKPEPAAPAQPKKDTPPPARPPDPAVADAEKALTDWTERGYSETVLLADSLKTVTDDPASYLAANMPRFDSRNWFSAARALIEFGSKDVFPSLRDHLKSKDPELRAAALHALIRLSAPPEDFLGALKDDDERVRLEALLGFEGVRVPDYLMVVPDLLLDDSRDVRVRAFEVFCRKAEEFKIQDLAAARVGDLLTEATPSKRTMLMQTLGRLGSADAVDAIASYLYSDEALEAADACTALTKINHPDARAALREALQGALGDDRSGHVVRLIEGVETQKDVRATPILVEFLEHDDDIVAQRAHKALGAISGMRGLPKSSEPWLKWYESLKLPETEPEPVAPKEKP